MMLTAALLYRPFFPPAVIALAVGVALALAGWSWWRSLSTHRRAATVGLVLRTCAIGVIGWLLLGPSRLPPSQTNPTRSTLNFLVDASGSMQTADLTPPSVGDNTTAISRYNYARNVWLNADRLTTLRQHYDVRLYSFGDRVAAALPDPADVTARQSNVVESTYQLLSTMQNDLTADPAAETETAGDISPGGVVILSDGRDSRGAAAEVATRLARARGIRLHTVTLGGATLTPDLALTATSRQPYLMVDEPGQIDVQLEQVNAAGSVSTFRIRHDGRESSQAVTFTDAGRLRIQVPVTHEQPGLYTYELSVDPLPGEPEAGNNAQTVFVEVTAQRMRVLVLEGQPFWDTKFLAQSLRRDERVELTQVTQINAERQERIVTRADDPAAALRVPQSLDDWSRYDVVVMGRGMENVLTPDAAGALRDYVSQRGGRVVFARGRAVETPGGGGGGGGGGGLVARALGVVEPVTWSSVSGGGMADGASRLELTDAGRGHPVFARLMQTTQNAPTPTDLPTLQPREAVESLKPATRVLAAAEGSQGGRPLLVEMPYGRGMVVGVLGEGLWRWRLAASSNEALVGVFDAFWSNMVRWLVLGADVGPGRDVALQLSGRSVALQDELTVTLVQRGEAAGRVARVLVTDPAGQTHELSTVQHDGADLRRVGGFVPTAVGIHTVRVEWEDEGGATHNEASSVETKFTAYDGNTELLHVATDPALMRQLAEGGGGMVLDPADPDALLKVLENQRAARLVPPTPAFIWDRGWIMSALLIGLGVAWLIRKKGGLL